MFRGEWLDPNGSSVHTHISRDGQGAVKVRHAQDYEPFFKANQAEFNSHDGASFVTPGGETFVKAFSLPPHFVQRLKIEYGLDINDREQRAKIIDMLSGSEFSKMQTRPGNFRQRPTRQYVTPRRRSSVVKLGNSAATASWVT